jgi:outer membrane protein
MMRIGMIRAGWKRSILCGTLSSSLAILTATASAETIEGALAKAYNNNPTLNAERATVRAVDENVPQALSGYRPRVSATMEAERSTTENRRNSFTPLGQPTGTVIESNSLTTRGVGLNVSQTIFNGNRTYNEKRTAESEVLASREVLRNVEQNTLLDAAEAYMNVLYNSAILDLRRNNLKFLRAELDATRERFRAGVVTRTDVAQAEASVAGAVSEISLAEESLAAARANYREVVGEEAQSLSAGRAIDRLLPKTLPEAVDLSLRDHPAIKAALHGADAASLRVKSIESELLPTLSVQGNVSAYLDPQVNVQRTRSASLLGVLTVPIYEGGGTYSRARQAKETYGARRLEADAKRNEVRAAVVSSWATLASAKSQIASATAQIDAAGLALAGVQEELKVGERTTNDVLDAQLTLLTAQTFLVQAQRDRIVASYSLLAAVGGLTADRLALKVQRYNPSTHYNQVRDKWWGLRTPSGQ